MSASSNRGKITRPFLRWAGGKSWLVPHLSDILSRVNYQGYHEPFLGGGAIFFSSTQKKLECLSDMNEALIECYRVVRDCPKDLIGLLSTFPNEKEFYYKIRKERFHSPIEKAAQFIYLNKTSFNGIYRENLNGEYNVPYGFRKINVCNIPLIRAASARLQNTKLYVGDFFSSLENIRNGDLVYIDPPYHTPEHSGAFSQYNSKKFSYNDVRRLSSYIDEIKNRNAYYILSYAESKSIRSILDKKDNIISLKRKNHIGGRNAERGQIKELIFTNIQLS